MDAASRDADEALIALYTGHYRSLVRLSTLLLHDLNPGKRLYLLATCTGLAPFLSITRDPEAYERFDRIVVAAAGEGEPGFDADDVVWLLKRAPGEIVVLRTDGQALNRGYERAGLR